MKKNLQKKGKALVYGSVVLDTIFDLTSSIRDQITFKDGKPDRQNLMFNALDKQVYFGGTAGNIAYGLGMLGDKPLVVSVAGQDFGVYAEHLKHSGAQSRIYIDEQGYTSMFYSMIDSGQEQIGVFQGNSYHANINTMPLSRFLKQKDWNDIRVAIFSSGTAKSIVAHAREFRKNARKDALIIFDPGQMLAVDFDTTSIEQTVRVADILIVNKHEAEFLETKFGFSKSKLWELGLKYFIVTHRETGSMLHTPKGQIKVKAYRAKKFVDPTGAGDAYRAGLIHGLLEGKTIAQAMDVGARLGAKCVAYKGAQTYRA